MKYLSPEELIRREQQRRRRLNRRQTKGVRNQEKWKLIEAHLVAMEEVQRVFSETHGVPPPRQAARLPLMVPKVVSLTDNRETTIGFVKLLRDTVLLQNQPVQLYFDQLDIIEPAAALLLVAEIFRCRQLRLWRGGTSVLGNYPRTKDMLFLLRELGFYRALSIDSREHDFPDDRPRGERSHFLGFQTMSSVHPALAADFCDAVTMGAFGMSALAKGKMVASLKEAMGNAHEHAYRSEGEYDVMPKRWWLAGHINPVHREMKVMILDQGVGIPNTLEPTAFEQVRSFLRMNWTVSDGTMIEAATQLRRTSTGRNNRGRGFEDMKRFIDTCDDGELRVTSNRGMYIYTKSAQSAEDFSESIGGTLIEWRIRHQGATVEVTDE